MPQKTCRYEIPPRRTRCEVTKDLCAICGKCKTHCLKNHGDIMGALWHKV